LSISEFFQLILWLLTISTSICCLFKATKQR